ncbi:ankyrin repeat domain-containing protein 27-like [Athalia rosae]|uniref:ankyrin repeat domain-containing protein 27-like n=1 Tax=Athalia rosae TaxID=37344 RepID=UPI0020335CE9|nr:ankyrin repeat domain-containing protein 27-like [Athalia rosae]
MDADEILYNPFYHSLRNEFRKKYEFALSKCWTICVPSGESLRGLSITDNFVDDHILKPHLELPLHFTSTKIEDPLIYKYNGASLELVYRNDSELLCNNIPHQVKIMSVEKGYNTEFQNYQIFIVDKPLHPKYTSQIGSQDNERKLNCSITSYKEAVSFLHEFSDQAKPHLEHLELTLSQVDLENFSSSKDLSSMLQDLTRHYWAIIMRKHKMYLQRDARFQKLLSTSLEVFIMHFLHEKIYSLLSRALEREDLYVCEKIAHLIDLGVTPDQLGADESLAISLPAAVVELATLDAREGPLEKLLCLRSTLDLIIAQIKAAFAEVQTKTEKDKCGDDSNSISTPAQPLSTDCIVSLLLYVIIKSRPSKLVTDLHYIQHFLWSISPQDGLSDSLVTFEAAVTALFRIQVLDLPHKSNKVKTELPIGELFEVMSRPEESVTPLDRQIHQLATMLEKCTQD